MGRSILSHWKIDSNEINLTNLEGSWLIFDNVRFEGPRGARLQPVNPLAFVRNVKAADYRIDREEPAQSLLVDIEYLSGNPVLTVELDGKPIFEQTLEKGRYVFEAPMPLVEKPTESKYTILVNKKAISKGKVTRTPQQKTIIPADYVNTFLGTAHSRWMIAPGPWAPFSMVKLSPDNQNSGWQAGYQPSFESVGMFSHIHGWIMSGLGMLPVTGPLKTKVGQISG